MTDKKAAAAIAVAEPAPANIAPTLDAIRDAVEVFLREKLAAARKDAAAKLMQEADEIRAALKALEASGTNGAARAALEAALAEKESAARMQAAIDAAEIAPRVDAVMLALAQASEPQWHARTPRGPRGPRANAGPSRASVVNYYASVDGTPARGSNLNQLGTLAWDLLHLHRGGVARMNAAAGIDLGTFIKERAGKEVTFSVECDKGHVHAVTIRQLSE